MKKSFKTRIHQNSSLLTIFFFSNKDDSINVFLQNVKKLGNSHTLSQLIPCGVLGNYQVYLYRWVQKDFEFHGESSPEFFPNQTLRAFFLLLKGRLDIKFGGLAPFLSKDQEDFFTMSRISLISAICFEILKRGQENISFKI